MKKRNETKIVIIGMGSLMEYIRPCYEEFIGTENLKNNIVAVKGKKNIEQKRNEFTFEIRLFDNLSALRDINPDIILFAPPPTLVPRLTEEALKVYYNELREKSMPLPDLYAFAPSPAGKYYLNELGEDIHVCNILPNLFYGVGGNTFITYPNEKHWPLNNKKRIEEFFKPLGGVIDVEPEHVLHMLATMVTVEIIKVGIFTMVSALEEYGRRLNYKDLAAYLRAYHEQKHYYFPQNKTEITDNALDSKMQKVFAQFYDSWFRGLQDYLIGTGMGKEKVRQVLIETIDLNLYVCQNEDKEMIEQSIEEHATKGGVLERGCLCFEVLMEDKIRAVFSDKDQDGYNSKFFNWVYHSYHVICEIVAFHCKRLSGAELPFEFTEEVATVVHALFIKNIIKLGGEKDLESVAAAIKPHFGQRVSGIVKAWEKYGLLDEGEYYLKHMDYEIAKDDNSFKSWEYYTGYIVSEMSQRAKEVLGNADEVNNRTFKDIEIIFGKTAVTFIKEISKNYYLENSQ